MLGGIFILDSSSGLDLRKLAYLAVFVLSLGCAWQAHGASPSLSRNAGSLSSLARAWWLIVAVLVVSLPVALIHDHPVELWLPDVAPCFLLGADASLALDAAEGVSRRFLVAGITTRW